jgi:hypothetical protein
MARKLFLTAMILFFDTSGGADRLLRLVIAAVVSATYLALLALARPFKRADDLYLACTANLLLSCWCDAVPKPAQRRLPHFRNLSQAQSHYHRCQCLALPPF